VNASWGDGESDRSATGLSRLFPSPNKGANQTSSPEKASESMANEKNPPKAELKHTQKPQPSPQQRATGFRAPLHFSTCSLSFLSNKSYFIQRIWLIIQLPREPVPWPVKARTLNTGCHISTPAYNIWTMLTLIWCTLHRESVHSICHKWSHVSFVNVLSCSA
jgi:hypothetical protein